MPPVCAKSECDLCTEESRTSQQGCSVRCSTAALTCTPSRHIPHSKGLGSSKWHLQWLSRVCRCRRQSQTRSFFQRCPVQTYTHSCYPAQQQTPLPGQSSGYEVEQKSAENKKATFHLTISELPVGPTTGLECYSFVIVRALTCSWEGKEQPPHPSSYPRDNFLLEQGEELNLVTGRLNAQFVIVCPRLLQFLLATLLPN